MFQFLSSFLFVSLVRFSLFLRRFVRTLKPVKAAAKMCTTFDLAHMKARIFKIDFKNMGNRDRTRKSVYRGRRKIIKRGSFVAV